MATLSYATVGSNDLERAKSFYDALLTPAGLAPMFEHPSGGRVYGQNGSFSFAVLGPFNGEPASAGNGSMVAFHCESRAEVNEFHARALKLGGSDEGAPGERAPGLYFAYARDLDGNKLCAYALG